MDLRAFTKTIRVVKLTAIILLVGFLQLSAHTNAQPITISLKNARLETVFREIIKQTRFNFVYNNSLIAKAKSVDVDVKDGSIDDVLRQCLRDQQLEYEIVDNTIIVKPKPNLSEFQKSDSLPGEITGLVTTEQGEPLENANISINRTKKGSITNPKGEFKLKDVRPDDDITISFVGYETVTIKKIGNRKHLVINLKIATNELDKAVVQAYGKTTQRYTTGDIGKVTAEEIEKRSIMNPLLALQGQVAGLEVTPTSGFASAPVKVDLRGINFVNNGVTTDPLYIIDGVPLTTLDLNGPNVNGQAGGAFSPGLLQNGLGGPASGQSPFFSLNPADIESIEVLKDADATAIYGSRGANGVILITTKKGKAGKTQFDLSLSQGVSSVAGHWAMLNTPEYLQMRREALSNDGITPTPGNAPDLLVWDTTRNTDWQKYLWGNQGKWTDLETSLSGGDANTTFRIGAGYTRSTDITTKSGANQRANISVNLIHKTSNRRMTIALSSTYSFAEANMIYLGGASTLPPDAPAVFDKKGNLNYAQWDALGTGSIAPAFPFANLLQPYDSKTFFLNTNLSLNYSIYKNVVMRVNLGYNNSQTNQTNFITIASQDPADNPTGTASFGNNRNDNWIVEPQLEYNGFVGPGKLNILVGSSLQKTTSEGLQVTGYGYSSDELIRTASNASSESASDNYGEYKYAALFGRIGYNWKDKYILKVGARRDGSSRFASGSQYGNFGSIGIAWLATEEPWLRKLLPDFVSFLKIQGSYGTTGTDAGVDYAYLSRWSNNQVLPYSGVSSLVPLQLQNIDYHWQVNHKSEVSLDFSFFKNAVGISAAFYENKCNNQLINFPTPEISGFTYVIANSPANVENHGYELSIHATPINTRKFSWNISVNGAINKNKLIGYPNFQLSPYTQIYKIGLPLDIVWRLHKTGVDPLTGQYSYQDKNHDGQVNVDFSVPPGTADDDRFAYDLAPKITGGLQSTFKFNNLMLSFSFYGKAQIGQNALLGSGLPGSIQNQSLFVFQNRWQKAGQVATVEKFTTTQSTFSFYANYSDATYTDASFIRLSNVAIGLNLPASFDKQMHLTSANVFINSDYLFVITKYKGLDPETQNFGGMPPMRTIRFGFKCGF